MATECSHFRANHDQWTSGTWEHEWEGDASSLEWPCALFLIRTGAAPPGPPRGVSSACEPLPLGATEQACSQCSGHQGTKFLQKQMPFILSVPLHDFPVRVSGSRLDSQSSMYQGNMQITRLLAELHPWQTELERTVKAQQNRTFCTGTSDLHTLWTRYITLTKVPNEDVKWGQDWCISKDSALQFKRRSLFWDSSVRQGQTGHLSGMRTGCDPSDPGPLLPHQGSPELFVWANSIFPARIMTCTWAAPSPSAFSQQHEQNTLHQPSRLTNTYY